MKKWPYRALLAALALTPAAWAADITWNGSQTPNLNWTNADNWTGGAPDDDADVLFDATSVATTSVVDDDLTIDSFLAQWNDETVQHTIEIAAGKTLLIDGVRPNVVPQEPAPGQPVNAAFAVARKGSDNDTNVSFVGEGTLHINSSSHFLVANFGVNGATSAANTSTARLDLSGLGTFIAEVDDFNVGYSVAGTQGSSNHVRGEVTLAQNNTITATNLRVGVRNLDSTPLGVLHLGQTNIINANNITVGHVSRGANNLIDIDGQYDGTATVIIRHSDGTGRANVTVGINDQNSGGAAGNNHIDLNGAEVDALLNNLKIGVSTHVHNIQASGHARGTLSFNNGVIDVNNVLIGQHLSAGTGPRGTGTLNMTGTATLVVNNELVLADFGNVNTAAQVTANVNLNGGTIAARTIRPGANGANPNPTANLIRRLNWTNGTLTHTAADDLTIEAGIDVRLFDGTHTFHADAGRFVTVNADIVETAVGQGIVKTGGGTLVLNGNNTYTGDTIITEGTVAGSGTVGGKLTVSAGATHAPGNSPGIQVVLGDYTLAPGATLEIEVIGREAGTGYDRVDVAGGVSIDGANLSLVLSAVATPGDLLFIVVNDGSDPVNGEFAGLADGSEIWFGRVAGQLQSMRISYFGDLLTNQFTGGNDIVLLVLPEPATALLVLAGTVLIGRARPTGCKRKE